MKDSTFRAEAEGQVVVQAETSGYVWILAALGGRNKKMAALRTDGIIRVGRREAEWRPER